MIRTSDNNSYVNQNPVVAEAALVEENSYISVPNAVTGVGSDNKVHYTITGNTKTGLNVSVTSFDGATRNYTTGLKFESSGGYFIVDMSNTNIASDSTWSFSIMLTATGGGTGYLQYSFDEGTNWTKTSTISWSKGSGTKYTIENISSDITSLHVKKGSGSPFAIEANTTYMINSDMSEEDIEKELVSSAIEAIDNIGEIEYSTECYGKIENAENCINKVKDISQITNYDEYTTAVSTYESLKENAIESFVSSVNELNDTPLTIKVSEIINACYDKYKLILETDRSEEVIESYNLLVNIEKSVSEMLYSTYSYFTDFSNIVDSETEYSESFRIKNSIFEVITTSDKKVKIQTNSITIDNKTYNGRFSFGGSSNASKGQRVIKFEVKHPGKINLISQCSSDSDKTITLLNGEFSTVDTVTMVNKNTVPSLQTIAIESAGTYYISANNNGYIYYLDFDSNFEINYQYDNDETPTKVRFVAAVRDCNLESIKSINLTLKKDGVNSKNSPIQITTVYTSVMNGDEVLYEAANNTYYIVYSITEINSDILLEQPVFEAILTINYMDSTSQSVSRSMIFGK